MNQFYLYRFLDADGNILYIGKSINLKLRIDCHLSKVSNVPSECIDNIAAIEMLETLSQADMDFKELYYIKRYAPKYNIVFNNGDILETIDQFDNKYWEVYNPSKVGYIATLENDLKYAEKQIETYMEIFSSLLKENKEYANKLKEYETI
ncbi:GIY-YIG nuclease family protein [Terrisporobacter sp.]|uniref:GIY-YIG nuclease family protein n=1 Tax=Terrisporobacter sp. TaxID=1965305 RepID=UPI0028A04E4D|nr:GIY-YIG nuclease family protein [Terrisporobacter sp.]